MIVPLLCVGLVFVVLCVSEILWRAKLVRGEQGRKFVHIFVGTFVAFWPFVMSFRAVQFISLAFLLGIVVSRQLNIFHAIHAVKRKSWGEVLFALSIALLAAVSPDKWIFAAAILHMGLADGLAAIIGDRYGKHNRYKILGQMKSLFGSLAFLVVSGAIVAGFVLFGPAGFSTTALPALLWLPLAATFLENVSPKGTDNVFVPLLVAAMLGLLY